MFNTLLGVVYTDAQVRVWSNQVRDDGGEERGRREGRRGPGGAGE